MTEFTFGDVINKLKDSLRMVRVMKENAKGEDRIIYGDVEKGLFLVLRKLSWHVADPKGHAGDILIFPPSLLDKLCEKGSDPNG